MVYFGAVHAAILAMPEMSAAQADYVKLTVALIALVLILPVVYFILLRHENNKAKHLKAIIDQTMLTFAKVIDAKDPYTRGHSEAVAEYSREIARRYGMPRRQLDNIYYSGLLHDIGKIAVPDSILNKPEKLTEDEYEAVKVHTFVGADILSSLTTVDNIAAGARDHHERYDGSGYPRGISGNDISLEGRIIGVADAYDAMASERVYRETINREKIREEFERECGRQFDPKIVKILLEMIDEGYFDSESD